MTASKELPSGLGKVIVIKKYSGTPPEAPIAAFCVGEDIFGTWWLEVDAETPRIFKGSRIDEWALGSVSAIENETDCVSGNETRVAYLIDQFSDDASFYYLNPPLMGSEYVVLTCSSGEYYVHSSDSMSCVSNASPGFTIGEFETNEDALKALGYQEAPERVTFKN